MLEDYITGTSDVVSEVEAGSTGQSAVSLLFVSCVASEQSIVVYF